jgi:2-(1,2-epoxy-1,2-dihydrophenyl)acetyl-CoA isomerase
MKHGRIILETTGDVAVMTLNDPGVLNAFGQKLREDMTVAMDQVEGSTARCLVITGAGRAFCSGANLNDPDRPPRDRAAEARGEVKGDLESWYNPMFMRLRNLSIPVVTAINGMAAGAGMSLALTGDIRVAARSASFLQAFARIGLVPNRIEEDAALMPRVMQLATSLAAGPKSLGLIRKMYWQGLENTYSGQLDLEAKLQSQAGLTQDYQEGVAAFKEKRPARFKGQ